jgi:E3 ubiquitin-protein ligase XBAT32/33
MQCMTFCFCLSSRWLLTISLFWLLQVTRADYLSGRTALHFAAHDGFVRCVRLLLGDFVLSVALEDIASSAGDSGDCQQNSRSSPNSLLGQKFNEWYVFLMNHSLLFERTCH